MRKRKLRNLLVLAASAIMLFVGCGDTTINPAGQENLSRESDTKQETTESETLLSGKYYVDIVIKDRGTIRVELDADVAPVTVTNFVTLAKEGFYDGTELHRIMEDFMMQGGAPLDNSVLYPTIKGEFSANGIENNLNHTRGAISMARAKKYDSASTQFFIVQEDSPHLDGQYACFGYVTEGMEVVDDICRNTKGGDMNGIIPKENRPIIETIRVLESQEPDPDR